jgi:hypothetical protein
MTASGETGDTQPAEHRQSRGIKVVGGDLRLSDLNISIGEDGKPSAGAPRVELRTDMWPFWLEEAIEAAAIASDVGRQIPALVEQLEEALELDDKARAGAVEDALTAILSRELRASMRAMTSCAFAIDAFYAMVKARSPDHPQQMEWTKNRTARKTQVSETFRHQLRIGNAQSRDSIRTRVSEIFQYRDWAVHPGLKYRDAEYRQDLNASMDWHFKAFRRENAVTATLWTVTLIDSLVALLDRGSPELVASKPYARRRMDEILAIYDAQEDFPPIERAEPPTGTGEDDST